MAAAAQRSGRPASAVRLVAVTKTIGVNIIRQLLDAGVRDLGENRVQELIKRAGMIQEYHSRLQLGAAAPTEPPRWHMIGHLQRNKVKSVLPWITCVHSLDSLRLAEELSAVSTKMDRNIDVLVEINASGEKSKFGVAVGAVNYLVEQVVTLPGLTVVGLMTMAPLVDDPEKIRPIFVRVREIFEELAGTKLVGPRFRELSMGMSQDYAVAIEEGATIVRIGTALFEDVASVTT
jgi:pyridoxal phosphate enzyme (YggS family)